MGTLRKFRLGIVVLVVCVLGAPPGPSGAAADVTITWSTQQRVLGDGRTYFVRAPACAPADSPGCVEYLERPRPLMIHLHAANAREDVDAATLWLASASSWAAGVIVAFGVSKDGTRRWDGGICCTAATVDDVGYLETVVAHVSSRWRVDSGRIGLSGVSNGAVLALRAICERPDLFAVAVALAGTYGGPCDDGPVRIGQWHGALDATVPLDGGTVFVQGASRTFPPVTAVAAKLVHGSRYELRVRPGAGHALPWGDYRAAIRWLVGHFPA